MAYEVSQYDNGGASTSDFPYGFIKDNPGDGTGTKANNKSWNDLYQFFMKIMIAAGISPNGQQDSTTNGFQLVQALNKLINQEPAAMAAAFGAATTTPVLASGMVTTGSTTLTTTPGWFWYWGQFVYFPGQSYSSSWNVHVAIALVDGLPTATFTNGGPSPDNAHFGLSSMVSWATAMNTVLGLTTIAGEISTLNTQVATINSEITTLQTDVALSGWTNATLASGWTDVGSPVRSMVTGMGQVFLEGAALWSSGVSGATMFTLPTGQRPSRTLSVTQSVYNIGSAQISAVSLTINTDGTVVWSAAGLTINAGSIWYFDGITFNVQ
jgi:hypothetical protein